MLPWYKLLFSDPYYTNDEDFYSSKYILEFSSPIMILHAEDDGIIPSVLGQKVENILLVNSFLYNEDSLFSYMISEKSTENKLLGQ